MGDQSLKERYFLLLLLLLLQKYREMREREGSGKFTWERENVQLSFVSFSLEREREGDESKGSAWNCVWVEDEKARKSLWLWGLLKYTRDFFFSFLFLNLYIYFCTQEKILLRLLLFFSRSTLLLFTTRYVVSYDIELCTFICL